MSRISLYRNVQARDQLDIFLVAAVSSLLLLRFYLSITGYPQIGAGNFHIAHVLWGGMFMLAGIVVSLSFLGMQAQRLSALLGGLGFGAFIDEIGKFITKDNNYFFQPTIGIIYAIFVGLYLLFNFLSRETKYTSREYQLNALAKMEEAIAHDMDKAEKHQAQHLLALADHRSPITQHLRDFLASVETVPTRPAGPIEKFLRQLDKTYLNFWRRDSSTGLVRGFFLAEITVFLFAVSARFDQNLDDLRSLLTGTISYGQWLVVGQLVTSLLAGYFIVLGALRLQNNRLNAFEQFRRGTLISLFLTEFFIFSRVQFEALPGFIFNLILLMAISYVFRQEQRLSQHDNKRHS